jgi:Xaa-Pro aminopeptidase
MDDSLTRRRARIARALPLGDAILLVGAGEPIPLPENSDQIYPFRSHAEYLYLAGEECAGGVVAFDPRDGDAAGWTTFVPPVTESERVWEGRGAPPRGRSIEELQAWLYARRARPIAALGSPLRDIACDAAAVGRIRDALTHARRAKDENEVSLVRRAVAATVAGYERLPEFLRPGITERAIQIELEAAFARAGARRTGYNTTVGSGPNSAILHFEPSHRSAQAGEFVLVDAGAEVDRYTADVTRTFVIGAPDRFRRDLYQVVLAAQERAIARCVVGAEWKAIHLACAVDLAAGLVDLGILRGSPESLVEQEAHALFFPHGLGHMVGLGVRDASGLAPGRQKDSRASLRTLRMDLPLAEGYLVTVEPGLYFIPPLLTDPARRTRFRDVVAWETVDRHLDVGGVRIEDDILITNTGPENLTAAIPKALP